MSNIYDIFGLYTQVATQTLGRGPEVKARPRPVGKMIRTAKHNPLQNHYKKQDRQCTYGITLRCFHVTTTAVEKQ